jgi:hypothetical protein
MNRLRQLLLAACVAGLSVSVVACNKGGDTDKCVGDACATDTDTPGASDTDTTADTDTTGADTDATCGGIVHMDTCGTCVAAQCCDSLTTCFGDPDCLACASGTDPALCQAAAVAPLFTPLATCAQSSCAVECAPPAPDPGHPQDPVHQPCNPVTNGGCTEPGAVCDFDAYTVGYSCFPPPNDVGLCGACDYATGVFCGAGTHCAYPSQKCAKTCCDDGDCGTGTCDKTTLGLPSGVGVCMGGGGTPACDAPATSPSNGSCVLWP